jgi:gas vesicle protein
MEMQEKNGMSVFWVGVLLGVASGAAVGLLYAPTRGRETRDYLSHRARQGRDLAVATAEAGREAVSHSREAVSQAKSVLSAALAEGRQAYRHTKAREAV